MITWLSILGATVSSALLFWLMTRSEYNARQRRSARICGRMPFTVDDWRQAMPSVPPETLEQVVQVISGAVGVPHGYLRPDDSFTDELSLKDRFWCLVIDDETSEDICDRFDERYGFRPDGRWVNLRDVVVEVWPLISPSPSA